MAENNPAMTKEDMKKVLRMNKPLRCAYGNSKDGMALMLDPKKMGRALLAEMASLKLQAPAHGMAERDQQDETKLNLMVNKSVAGSAKRLAKSLRGTGIKRVSIIAEEGEPDSAEDEAPEEDGAGSAASGGTNGTLLAGAPQDRALPPVPAQRPANGQGASAAPASAPPQPTVRPSPRPAAPNGAGTSSVQAAAPQPQAKPSGTPDLIARMQAAANRLKVGGVADPSVIKALTSARAFLGTGDTNSATKLLAAVEAKLGMGGASAAAAQVPQPGPDQVKYERARGAAQRDLDKAAAARAPGTAADRQALGVQVGQMDQLRGQGNYAGALALVAPARKLAIRVIGTAAQTAQQQDVYDRMAGPLQKVRQGYFTKAAGENMRGEKLSPGKEFKAFMAALSAFEDARDARALDALEATAGTYLGHYDNDLSDRQKNHKESLRKKQICETSLAQARHMRMALQMQDLGPPPWDEDEALAASAMRAQFGFESLGVPAKPLANDEGGVSAAFWVKGYDTGATKADGTPDMDAGRSDFLFKPAAGEEDTPPFRAGDAAPREAVTKALADKIALMIGADLGVPQTSIVSLPPETVDFASYNEGRRRKAAEAGYDPEGLIDGAAAQAGSLQQFRSSRGAFKEQPAGFAASIPRSVCEMAGVLDILSLNTDRHGGNFMVDERDAAGGGREPTLIPIDHGLTLPTRDGMRVRGSQRMNDAGGNVLLSMPGSHQDFSPEMQERLAMLDPDGIEQGIKDSVAAVQRAHPGLDAAGRIGDDSARMAKRSAQFLRRACRQLSPALVQLALANEQEAIFDSADHQFDAAADQVIARYAPHKAALQDFYVNDGGTFALHKKLKELGYHPLSSFESDMTKFKRWFAANATALLAAARNDTRWTGQPAQPS